MMNLGVIGSGGLGMMARGKVEVRGIGNVGCICS